MVVSRQGATGCCFFKKDGVIFSNKVVFFQTKGAKLAKYVFYHQYMSSVPQSGNFGFLIIELIV
jgi:hypothetical protein